MGGSGGTTFHWGEAITLATQDGHPNRVKVVFDDATRGTWVASSDLMWADSTGIVRMYFDEALESGMFSGIFLARKAGWACVCSSEGADACLASTRQL